MFYILDLKSQYINNDTFNSMNNYFIRKKSKIAMSYENWSVYSDYQYSGLIGWLMKFCHKELENNLPEGDYNKILEIGPGPHPHIDYLNHSYKKYYILEKTKKIVKHLKKLNYKNITVKVSASNKIPFKKNFFDRIIMSHVLEHIVNPEKFIFEAMSKLKKGGVLSIALPTDPGLLWRSGRFYSKFFNIIKKRKISPEKYDYVNAKDHVNSIYNLYYIIKFNYKKKITEQYLPFRVKIFDLNLFYNVHITK